MREEKLRVIENPLPVPELLARAYQGDADCQYWAGVRYYQGQGVRRNRRKAVELCQRAAEQGHIRALAFVAYCRFGGEGLEKDVSEAVRLYRRSAAGGYAPAQHTLGTLYLTGTGVKQNVRLGVRLLKKAGMQGLADAYVRLGRLYRYGKQVLSDDREACRWFRKAAEMGDAEGQFQLGGMLFGGHGVERDVAAALEYLDLSAAQGFAGALKMKAHMDEFVTFDPDKRELNDCPLDHPFPLRRRTAHLIRAQARPAWRVVAADLIEYAKAYPQNEEAAVEDAAILLAVVEGG